MSVQIIKEKFSSKIAVVTIGATPEQGGTRTKTVTVGGESNLPFMHFEGETPNKPVIAMEILDRVPADWDDVLKSEFEDVFDSPAKWAQKCVDKFGADLIYLRLQSADPEMGNRTPEQCAKTVKDVLSAVGVPLIVVGCGQVDVDNKVISEVASVCSGENLLLGVAKQEDYSTIVAACMVHKHTLIAESPIDINICKQLNILINDMGLPLDRIIIDPSIGGLGYGIEYVYSIMERGRLGALQGDRMLAMPVLATVGAESWKAKEAYASIDEFPGWGEQAQRGILWEAMTASCLLQGGIDILVMRHPKAVTLIRKHIDDLMVPSMV